MEMTAKQTLLSASFRVATLNGFHHGVELALSRLLDWSAFVIARLKSSDQIRGSEPSVEIPITLRPI